MRLISKAFGVVSIGAAIGLVHCGGSTNLGTPQDGGIGGDGGNPIVGEVPLKHFPAGATCRATRPAGTEPNNDDGGDVCGADSGSYCACGSDAECTAGKNGRCIVNSNSGFHCTYDDCFAASDCATGNSCACGDISPYSNNVCVPSNCRVDTDCGANGYCSPSYGSCGTFGGEYGGVYCHTAKDECVNDSDCTGNGETSAQGYCSFDTANAAWACSYSVCAG